MADLTLVGLRVLREVAARGSFTAAADSLGYTQSAVSRQVAALEAAAGAPLFERGSRGVRLTDEGHVLLRHAGGVLDQVDAARRELGDVRGLAKGRLRVGAFPTAVAALLPRALAAFGSRHAGVEISLREGTTPSQLRRLRSGATELAVVGTLPGQPLDRDGLAFEPLLDDPLLLAVARGHALARRRIVDLDDLAGERWIAGSSDASETFLGVWDSLRWQPRVEFVAREWTAKLGLVAAGLGVTLVPGLAASAVRDDVALVRVRSERPPMRTVVLATRAATGPPARVRAFADVLHEVAAELAVDLQGRIRDR
jgi:DNA-binding transcriptional LysR family regulator